MILPETKSILAEENYREPPERTLHLNVFFHYQYYQTGHNAQMYFLLLQTGHCT